VLFERGWPAEIKSLVLVVAGALGWLVLWFVDETFYVSATGERLPQPAVFDAILPILLGVIAMSWWYLIRSFASGAQNRFAQRTSVIANLAILAIAATAITILRRI